MTFVAKPNIQMYWQQWLHVRARSHTFSGRWFSGFSPLASQHCPPRISGHRTSGTVPEAELKLILLCCFPEPPKAISHLERGLSFPGKFLNPADLFYPSPPPSRIRHSIVLTLRKSLKFILLLPPSSTQMPPTPLSPGDQGHSLPVPCFWPK